MEIQQLRHLMAAATHGNLLKAAEESCISQSGLSRSIKSLEDRLGVPLLDRKPKGVEPTVYGLSVLRRAQVILNEVQRSIEELRAIEEARFGHVTIGVTQNYANYVVPEILVAVRRERPALRLKVLTGGFLELISMINTEAIDFGFGIIGSLMQDDGIVVERLRAHQSKVFVRVGHPLAGTGPVSVAALAEADWMMLTSTAVQRGFAAFFERRGLMTPSQSLTTDSLHLIRSCLRHSDALTILPAEAAARDVGDGLIVELECDTPVEDSQIGFFHRRGGVLTPQAQYLLDHFRSALGQTPPLRKARTLTPRISDAPVVESA